MNHNFGENQEEFSSRQGKKIPVWKSPKYEAAKKKAIEMIESEKYGLEDGDFWILMNETKSGKMAYTGLIISHNGCLKINDRMPAEQKFAPECVQVDKAGYDGSLVFSYCNKDQGMYEVGEFSKANGKNTYPYAMAFKRLFDRVVLKLSKLAFAGVYSDSESDEFVQRVENREGTPTDKELKTPSTPEPESDPIEYHCEGCGNKIVPVVGKKGDVWSVQDIVRFSAGDASKPGRFGRLILCPDCQKLQMKAEQQKARYDAGV